MGKDTGSPSVAGEACPTRKSSEACPVARRETETRPFAALGKQILRLGVICVFASISLPHQLLADDPVWMDSLDLGKIMTSGRTPKANRTAINQPIKINDLVYPHGVGLSSCCYIRVNLKRAVTSFSADLSLNDGRQLFAGRGAVYVDGRRVADPLAGTNRKAAKMYPLKLDLTGASELLLVFCDSTSHDLAGARFQLKPGATERPEIVAMPDAQSDLIKDPSAVVWLDRLPLLLYSSGDGRCARLNCTPRFEPLMIAGTAMGSGFSLYPRGRLFLDLKGQATRFIAQVGVNDSTPQTCGQKALFRVYRDRQVVFDSGPMAVGDKPKPVDVPLEGARELVLAVDDSGGSAMNRAVAVWAWPRVLVTPGTNAGQRVAGKLPDQVDMPIATIKDGPEPALHGTLVAGASPGHSLFYAIPATGEKPLRFSADKLPPGLTLDPVTGFVTGTLDVSRQLVTFTVSNRFGTASRQMMFVCEPYAMALTPPLGWNSWHQWEQNIDDQKIRDAADAMAGKGFAAHGFTYINLDDGWEGGRRADGILEADPAKFKDMKALGDYLHAKGLKFGIYSSPGPLTCGKREGSLYHEKQDADLWASWGVDYIKYDRCSGSALADMDQRWIDFRAILDSTGRDIVYSANSCRDEAAKAQLWRTTGDIRSSWASMSDTGFNGQRGLEQFARPGRFNDPDMLIVGHCEALGSQREFSLFPITRNEQITQISLWSMLAAPLLLGCNLTRADEFLVSLMCNDDVLSIDQDPLVRQGKCFRVDPPRGNNDMGGEVWTRPLYDGTVAVAFFNRGCEPVNIKVTWKELGFEGAQPVRDCWLRKDLGTLADGYEVRVEVHGAVVIKVGTPHPERLAQYTLFPATPASKP